MTGRLGRGKLIAAATALVVAALFFGAKPGAAFAAPAIDDRGFHRGLLLLPFVGANLPLGDPYEGFDLGFRAGGLAGYHVLPYLSANVEGGVDYLNPNNLALGTRLQARVTDFTLSPFFHLALDRGEIVMGPRIGAFTSSSSLDSDRTTYSKESARGLAYGFNLGVFGGIGDIAVGALLGYTRRHTTKTDVTVYQGSPPGRAVPNALSVAVAVLF